MIFEKEGWYRLRTDGSVSGNTGKVGAGGATHDN